MKVTKAVLLFMIFTFLAGCVPVRKDVKMTKSFNHSDHRGYSQSGNNTIAGQAFLRQRGGGTVTCAGFEVFLMPNTPFFQEIINIIRQGNKPAIYGSPFTGYGHKTICDAQGNFEFNNIPSLPWVVMTEVKWMVKSQQGGILLKHVNLTKNEKIILSDRDRLNRY